jgi:hypothetical protein
MNALRGLLTLSNARSRRISSYEKDGGNSDYIKFAKGETAVLADIEGAGIVNHIWITVWCDDPLYRKNLILRAYWDDQDHPSIEAPLGDFFGNGFGETYLFNSLPLIAGPKSGRALTCYFQMPFAKGARITIENQCTHDVPHLYYYIDYEEHEKIGDDVPRFHAQYMQEYTKPEGDGDRENEWSTLGDVPKNPSDKDNYLIADIEGRGHFVGVNYYVQNPGPMWYGEGDDMFQIDGQEWPDIHGTGSEDYFGQSWSPDEIFQHPYFGTARAPGKMGIEGEGLFGWIGRTHCYRFHITDPIHFKKSLRASIEHGHANVLTLNMSTVAYWYQTMPAKPFRPFPSAEERKPKPDISTVDIHKWREAWRQSKGGGQLWGNED